MTRLIGSRDPHFINFIFGLLEFDPAKRLTPTQALAHPFLASLFPFALLSTHGRPYHESLYSRVASSNAFKFIFESSPLPNGVKKEEEIPEIKQEEEEEKIDIEGIYGSFFRLIIFFLR